MPPVSHCAKRGQAQESNSWVVPNTPIIAKRQPKREPARKVYGGSLKETCTELASQLWLCCLWAADPKSHGVLTGFTGSG